MAKKTKKINKKNQNKFQEIKPNGPSKTSAKLVLFIFGIGPIIGIIIFLAAKGFFKSPGI